MSSETSLKIQRRQLGGFLPNRYHCPVVVNASVRWHAERGFGSRFENAKAARDKGWRVDVVVRRPGEERGRTQGEHALEVRRSTQILWIARVSDSLVALRDCSAMCFRVVLGGVVTDDDFNIDFILGQEGGERAFKIRHSIEHRETDAYARRD
jgi:hypothetical protein